MMPPVSRRRFVQGIAAAGVLAATPWPLRGFAAANPAPVLKGTVFDLAIGELPVNITGQPRMAVAVNNQVPAPVLRWREGDTVTLRVTNRLSEPTSIHWHGILLPNSMDGVPGLTFHGIAPGETFTYQFPVKQSGTYWYHSHSAFQEQQGLYGPLVIEPKAGYPQGFDRDYVVFLSDWTDENPNTVMGNLKFQADYYNRQQRTLGTFFRDVSQQGLAATVSDRLMWGEMRMSPTDILDVSGQTYTYLINGQPPAANWTALFRPGERVRLRFINGSAMSIFDVGIPGLPMTVVQADGIDVRPVAVDQFRIGTAETYDVIVEPREDRAFTIFVQAEDRSGFGRATLAPRAGMAAPVPPLDPRPMRTMADMGMEHGSMGGMPMDQGAMSGMNHGAAGGMPQINHGSMPGMNHGAPSPASGMGNGAHTGDGAAAASNRYPPPTYLEGQVGVDNVAMTTMPRVDDPGAGFPLGRRVLRYTDLQALTPARDSRSPSRDIVLHLTGNMERFMWGFDGKKFSEAPDPILLRYGERVRFVLINDTMMEHPIHLHGMFSELETGHGEYRPLKHTVLVKPAEQLSFLVTADAYGRWAFHCHLLFHMEAGMFREVRVI
ncbi:MAG: copper resistance system multicopper oxidase [Rhizobiaceae bacterium]